MLMAILTVAMILYWCRNSVNFGNSRDYKGRVCDNCDKSAKILNRLLTVYSQCSMQIAILYTRIRFLVSAVPDILLFTARLGWLYAKLCHAFLVNGFIITTKTGSE